MDRVEAQQARRVLDRLVGYQLSPLLWRKVQGRLSAGRVQSVAVRLVVEREREIEAFDSLEYWTIGAELSQTKFRELSGNNGSRRPFFVGRLHRLNGAEPELGSEAAVQPHVAALQRARDKKLLTKVEYERQRSALLAVPKLLRSCGIIISVPAPINATRMAEPKVSK